MRFVTYRTVETEPRLGLLHDGLVIDVEYFGDAIGQDLPSTMLDFIDLGPIGPRSCAKRSTARRPPTWSAPRCPLAMSPCSRPSRAHARISSESVSTIPSMSLNRHAVSTRRKNCRSSR